MENTFFGHPRGLSTLFFTEMWERFSYYGMRALLFLFMVTTVEEGGLGLDEKTGGAIYGLYTMLVYLMALPGGWLADNIFGLRRTIFYGAIIITLGHFLLVFESLQTFFLGLFLIVVGTGMLKPNISTLVGELYNKQDDARRDSGYVIFFMGINVGAFIAPFVTGYFGEKVNWHYGFAIAGLGMVIGLVQYKMSEKYLGNIGKDVRPLFNRSKAIRWLLFVVLLLVMFFVAMFTGVFVPDPVWLAQTSGYVISVSGLLYFLYLIFFAALNRADRKNVITIFVFFFASVVFYIGYEQQGSSLNLFALRYTNMFIGEFEMPASWLQSVPAVSVLLFAPIFAWLWMFLSNHGWNPSVQKKMSWGLIFVGISYLVMCGAALIVAKGGKALPTWLIATYVLHTFGEICLYPVGLSAVQKLAPKRFSAQLMGVWFLSLSLGNLMAGLLAGRMSAEAINQNPSVLVDLFLTLAVLIIAVGSLLLIFASKIPSVQTGIKNS